MIWGLVLLLSLQRIVDSDTLLNRRVTRPHGNSGVVKSKFSSNLPPHAFGASVRIVCQRPTIQNNLRNDIDDLDALPIEPINCILHFGARQRKNRDRVHFMLYAMWYESMNMRHNPVPVSLRYYEHELSLGGVMGPFSA